MIKKHQKIMLNSQIFKAKKTPQKMMRSISKSPTARSPAYLSKRQQQKIDPNELFQKVCCPNCRYVFKIIKNNQILIQNSVKKKEKEKQINVTTQTDQFMSKEIKQLKKLNEELSRQLNASLNQSMIFKNQNNSRQQKHSQQMHSQSIHLKQMTYRFEDLAPNKINASSKVSLKSEKQSDKQGSFLDKLKNNKSNKFQKSKEFDNKSTNSHQIQQKRNNESELINFIAISLRNEVLLSQLITLCKQLPSSVQISSYNKMLIEQFLTSQPKQSQ